MTAKKLENPQASVVHVRLTKVLHDEMRRAMKLCKVESESEFMRSAIQNEIKRIGHGLGLARKPSDHFEILRSEFAALKERVEDVTRDKSKVDSERGLLLILNKLIALEMGVDQRLVNGLVP